MKHRGKNNEKWWTREKKTRKNDEKEWTKQWNIMKNREKQWKLMKNRETMTNRGLEVGWLDE